MNIMRKWLNWRLTVMEDNLYSTNLQEDKLYLTNLQYNNLKTLLKDELVKLKEKIVTIEDVTLSNMVFQIEMLVLCLTDFVKHNSITQEYELDITSQNKERLLGFIIYKELQ